MDASDELQKAVQEDGRQVGTNVAFCSMRDRGGNRRLVFGAGRRFLIVPSLFLLGLFRQKAVGTSRLAILVISFFGIAVYKKPANVDYKAGIFQGLGCVLSAQMGARLFEDVSTAGFRKIFSLLL